MRVYLRCLELNTRYWFSSVLHLYHLSSSSAFFFLIYFLSSTFIIWKPLFVHLPLPSCLTPAAKRYKRKTIVRLHCKKMKEENLFAG